MLGEIFLLWAMPASMTNAFKGIWDYVQSDPGKKPMPSGDDLSPYAVQYLLHTAGMKAWPSMFSPGADEYFNDEVENVFIFLSVVNFIF